MAFFLIVMSGAASAQVAAVSQPQADDIPSTRSAFSGKLFFTPQQRAALDRRRYAGAKTDSDEVVDQPSSGLSGFLKRSDGNAAVWVDGRMLNVPEDAVEKIRPDMVGSPASTLRVKLTGDGAKPAIQAGARHLPPKKKRMGTR